MTMTLRQLDAEFIRFSDPAKPRGAYDCKGITFEQAQGVMFLCPRCFLANNGAVGTHSILCWFRERGVPDDLDPKPGRWTPTGTGIDDLTFVPGVPPKMTSIKLDSGCCAHFFIERGVVRWC